MTVSGQLINTDMATVDINKLLTIMSDWVHKQYFNSVAYINK